MAIFLATAWFAPPVAAASEPKSADHAVTTSQPSALAIDVARLRVPPSDLKDRIAAALKRQISQAIQANHQNATSTSAAMQAFEAAITGQFETLLVPESVRAAAEVYDRTYTQAELAQLRDFYSTKTGQLLFGKAASDAAPSPEAVEAANSVAGKAFLQSALGRRENGGVAWAAEEAAAQAVARSMPTVAAAVQARVAAALSGTGNNDR